MFDKELRGSVVAPTIGNKDKAMGQHAHIFDHFLVSLMSLFSLWFSLFDELLMLTCSLRDVSCQTMVTTNVNILNFWVDCSIILNNPWYW